MTLDSHADGRVSTLPVGAVPAPPYRHLFRLTDDTGLFEHARGPVPKRWHGYCIDDVARGLLVVCREPEPASPLVGLAERYLAFLIARPGQVRRVPQPPGLRPACGTTSPAWATGGGAACGAWGPPRRAAPRRWIRAVALERFGRSAAPALPLRPRAMAFAALGAAEVRRRRARTRGGPRRCWPTPPR